MIRMRSWLLAASLALAPGCAGWFPGDAPADPMQAELERLEQEQRRMAHEERVISEAESREREQNPKTLEDRLHQGDAHLANGEMASALWEYASAHRIDPESPEPRVRLGYVHLRHEPERARPLFESALERDPDHVSAHIGLGLSLFASGDRKDGLRHLERAVALSPRSAKAHAALGVSLDQLGRSAQAVAQLEAARDLRPRDARILNNLGVAYLRAGKPEEAEHVLRAAIRQDTRDASLRANNLGMALAMQGRFDEALESFRRAGDEQSARSNLGYAHHMRGEYALAITEYEKALVAGGDASLQVVRNLEAARHALNGQETGAEPELEPTRPQVAEERRSEDPWLVDTPPAALAD